MKKPKILLIGQGLAGTVLSFSLLRKGIAHTVLDNRHKGAATHAAAGIINPITGKRYVKSWMVDSLIPFADQFYSDISAELDIDIIKRPNIFRSLKTVGDENNWSAAIARPEYQSYAEDTDAPGQYSGHIQESLSYGLIRKGMQVNISELISSYQLYLERHNMIIYDDLDHSQINWENNPVRFQGQAYDMIIFCEGHAVSRNPLFNFLPFQGSKGEALIIDIEAFDTSDILRDSIFLVPFGKSQFWSGGGYKREELDESPTKKFRIQWKEKLDRLLLKPYMIKDHKAGIRPTVIDRRPILGQHPALHHLYIFNGMGTKGTSLGPYWADKFIQYLFENRPLDGQVDLRRFN